MAVISARPVARPGPVDDERGTPDWSAAVFTGGDRVCCVLKLLRGVS